LLLTDDRRKALALWGTLHSKKEVAKAVKVSLHILQDKLETCFTKVDDEEEDERSESPVSSGTSGDSSGEASGSLSVPVVLVS